MWLLTLPEPTPFHSYEKANEDSTPRACDTETSGPCQADRRSQLKMLDKINGKNRGAKKERARLTKRIANR